MERLLITICGRAGSKGFKNKNLKTFCGRPLVYYSLAAAQLFLEKMPGVQADICLNTDSEALAALVAEKYPEVAYLPREAALGGDTAPKMAVIQDSLARMEARRGCAYDYVMDLDITSPLRTAQDIRNAYELKSARPDLDLVYSVTESRRNPYFNMVRDCGDHIEKGIENRPEDGTREITFSRHLYVEAEDFLETPVPKYKRLYPDGPECRLKGAYLVKCTGCVKDENGQIVEILCTYDPDSRGGDPADGRKVKGATLHWVDAENCVDAEVRLYDNLFSDPQPDGPDKDFLNCLNPDSLMVLEGCKVERAMVDVARDFDRVENRTGINAPTFQFMRTGYFCMDNRDCTADHLVFNRSVSLKDSFKK